MTFQQFKLHPSLLEGLSAMGYDHPTPIQERAIPAILQSRDLVANAQTGTGKTATYLLPILHKLADNKSDHVNTLIIVPTRELALQVDQQVEGLGYFAGISSIPVYGGGDGGVWSQQRKALDSSVDIVVATPGRLIAHLASGMIQFDQIRHLVLDEADRMLDMGFYEDIVRIVGHLPVQRQTLLFSATMPPKIKVMANTILRDPIHIAIAIAKPAENISQQAYYVEDGQKIKLLTYLLEKESYSSVIVFASTRESVKKLEGTFRRSGMRAKAFHSDLDQQERERILQEFKNRKLPIIIGTDILSRGIDVEGIDLVVNFNVPSDPEDYVHRIGRTARAGRAGVAVTFINHMDQRNVSFIEKLIGKPIPKMDLPIGFEKSSPNRTDRQNRRRSPRKFNKKHYPKNR